MLHIQPDFAKNVKMAHKKCISSIKKKAKFNKPMLVDSRIGFPEEAFARSATSFRLGNLRENTAS